MSDRMAIVLGIAVVAACGGGGSGGSTSPDAGASGGTSSGSTSASSSGSSSGGNGSSGNGSSGSGSSGTSSGSSTSSSGGDAGIPSPTAVCGSSMLAGPTTAPAGAVTVSPGATTIQDAISAHAAGTTYYLTAGTYSITSSINPQDGDTIIGAPGAIIDGSGTQPVAFGYNAHPTGVTLKYLTVQNFNGPMNNGVVNQGQGASWTIEYDTIQNNAGANGVEVGDDDVIQYNCFKGNGQTGISGNSATGFTVDHNEVASNAIGYEAKYGCGCSGGMKFFTSTNGTITNNWVHDNGSVGIWIDTNNSFFLIDGNVVENTENEAIMYEISYNAVIRNNVIRYNGISGNASTADFPEPAIYVSESGGFDTGAAVMLGGVDVNGTLLITNNTFLDNADGVVLYQNADRCCGTKDGCSSCAGGTSPLYMEVDADGNQRWNTQNVAVSNNTFTYDSNGKCMANASQNQYCSVQAVFSTSTAIDQKIAFGQNNVFRDNTYTGPWMFLTPDQGSSLIGPSAWQGAPNNQDMGSTFH